MAILTSKSHRFSRASNYTMPEYRPSSPQMRKSRISVVIPATHERMPSHRNQRSEVRG